MYRPMVSRGGGISWVYLSVRYLPGVRSYLEDSSTSVEIFTWEPLHPLLGDKILVFTENCRTGEAGKASSLYGELGDLYGSA